MKRLNIISLGAGVQSSTMALMVAKGELPPVDGAIFSDVKWEPKAVYDWLDQLEPMLPFPVYRVIHKDGLRQNIIESLNNKKFAGAPFYTESPDADGVGQLRRQCTREFKIQPIERKLRELLGVPKHKRAANYGHVDQWIGISLDEIVRMKDSRVPWITNHYPLVDKRMSRHDCLLWMERNGYPVPPRSACIGCPYRSNREWRAIRERPAEWEEAIYIDELIRSGVRGTKEKLYLHKSAVPLRDVDLSTEEEQGQTDMFSAECEGMCGL